MKYARICDNTYPEDQHTIENVIKTSQYFSEYLNISKTLIHISWQKILLYEGI